MKIMYEIVLSKKNSINALAQVIGTIIISVPILLSLDPFTPIVSLFFALPFLCFFFNPSPLTWLPFFIPLGILSAGTGITNLFFAIPPEGILSEKILTLGFLKITDFSLRRAISIFSRTASLTVISSLCATTTNPLELVHSLMQNAKLPPRWGFALYAGLNLLPSMKDDVQTMKHARRIRLCGKKETMKDSLSLPVFLLAAAIRRAERIAISMSIRGIENDTQRSYIRKKKWNKMDSLFVTLAFFLCTLILFVSVHFKIFLFNLG